jgi:hypothetical protein
MLLTGLESPTPAALRHLERVVGVLRDGGLGIALAHHALHVLGSRAFGFSQDLFEDKSDAPSPVPAAAFVREFPHLAELAAAARHDGVLGGCDDDAEFEFAVRLLIDGLGGPVRP